MDQLTPEQYDELALRELEAAAATDMLAEKKLRLNQAASFVTLAQLAREASGSPA